MNVAGASISIVLFFHSSGEECDSHRGDHSLSTGDARTKQPASTYLPLHLTQESERPGRRLVVQVVLVVQEYRGGQGRVVPSCIYKSVHWAKGIKERAVEGESE